MSSSIPGNLVFLFHALSHRSEGRFPDKDLSFGNEYRTRHIYGHMRRDFHGAPK